MNFCSLVKLISYSGFCYVQKIMENYITNINHRVIRFDYVGRDVTCSQMVKFLNVTSAQFYINNTLKKVQ